MKSGRVGVHTGVLRRVSHSPYMVVSGVGREVRPGPITINSVMRLFEITLLEYDTDLTLKNWGKRIAKAASLAEITLEDEWFYMEVEYPDDGVDVKDEASLAKAVLNTLEKMDPTPNKQYVMTLVRWYVGIIKRDDQLRKAFDSVPDNPDSWNPPEDYTSIDPEHLEGWGETAGEDFELTPQNLNTFKLEDGEQVRDALQRFHEIKQRLPQNQRDINRFKTFYRFEEFVDEVTDTTSKQGDEFSSELLNRKDVEVLYDDVYGTVTIPRSEEASCQLGRGTRWCTAGRFTNMYKEYSRKADLIIYNEKPGNAKYQFQYYFDIDLASMQFEAADARDRPLDRADQNKFLNKHPVMSPILQRVGQKSFLDAMNKPYNGETPDIEKLIALNNQLGGGTAKPYIDDYIITRMEQKSQVDQEVGLGLGRGIDTAVAYAQIRGKPWPKFEELAIKHMELLYSKIIEHWQKQAIRGIGPSRAVAFLKLYINALQIYRDKVNPSWKAFQLFVDKYKKSVAQTLQKEVDDIDGDPYRPYWHIKPRPRRESVDEMRLLMTLSEASQYQKGDVIFYVTHHAEKRIKQRTQSDYVGAEAPLGNVFEIWMRNVASNTDIQLYMQYNKENKPFWIYDNNSNISVLVQWKNHGDKSRVKVVTVLPDLPKDTAGHRGVKAKGAGYRRKANPHELGKTWTYQKHWNLQLGDWFNPPPLPNK